MEHIAPLIQTVLWVGVISVVLWKFYAPLYGLLTALQKRIEEGSNVKAGPFEITELKPQDPLKQKEKTETEIQEVLETIPASDVPLTISASPQRAINFQAKYFQAEDLVLRAIQAEYGVTLSRQVTAGRDMGFDGAFVTNGRLNIVEVKYVANTSSMLAKLRMSVQRLSAAISGYGWHNVQIILVVVFDDANDVPKASEKLQELSSASSVPLVIRCYSLTELQLKFGVADDQ